jgi:hypothetical protein
MNDSRPFSLASKTSNKLYSPKASTRSPDGERSHLYILIATIDLCLNPYLEIQSSRGSKYEPEASKNPCVI